MCVFQKARDEEKDETEFLSMVLASIEDHTDGFDVENLIALCSLLRCGGT